MLRTMFTNWGTLGLWDVIFLFLSYALIILVALPVHEMAHAYSAYRMGDSTAKWNGRLTMNPFAHLDPMGTLMIFVFGFGYAKPVPVNPRNFRNPRTGMMLTSLCGPLSNLLMALITFGLLRVTALFSLTGFVSGFATYLIYNFAYVNVMLAVFNLLPIPPLDGYHIIARFLPARWLYMVEQYHWYFNIGIFLLIATGMLSRPLGVLVDYIAGFFMLLFGF